MWANRGEKDWSASRQDVLLCFLSPAPRCGPNDVGRNSTQRSPTVNPKEEGASVEKSQHAIGRSVIRNAIPVGSNYKSSACIMSNAETVPRQVMQSYFVP